MNTKKHLLKLRQWQESLITVLVSWVPLSPGRVLRRLLYPSILGRIGRATRIEPGVEFMNADLIELGHDVHIDRYARVRSVDRSNRIRLGDRVRIGCHVELKVHSADGGHIEIGEDTLIGSYSCLSGRFIKIGKDCLISPYVGIFANNHVFLDPMRPIREQGHTYQGIEIEDDCWLGTGVKVMDGVKIGRGSVIGAGAVVTKDIPPYSIAVGVPAKVVSCRGDDSNNAELMGCQRDEFVRP
jgi:acetyltransferase-like isoleucine patch superfamily enzyme